MFFPMNLIGGVIGAVIYCYVFFKSNRLGRYRKPFFNYAVFMQVFFLVFYVILSIYLRMNLQNNGLNILFNGIYLFYFALYIPFFLLIFYTLYKNIHSLEDYSKMTRYSVLTILLLLLVAFFILGLYVFIFAFYGFAP